MKLERVGRVSMRHMGVKICWQVEDADGFERTPRHRNVELETQELGAFLLTSSHKYHNRYTVPQKGTPSCR